jgi:transposase
VTPITVSAGGWKHLSLLGMITWSSKARKTGNLAWVKHDSVNTGTILGVLDDMKRKYEHGGSHFILVWDGLPPHRSKATRDIIEANKGWLTVIRFPAYAPELNPQEYQWSSLKRKDLGNYCPPTMKHLTTKVRSGLRRMKRSKSILKGFLVKSGLWSGRELGEGQ